MPVREVDLLGIDGLDELMNGDLPLPLNADGLLVPEECTRQPTEFVPGVKSIVLPRHHALLKGIYSVVFWLHAHTCTDPLESTRLWQEVHSTCFFGKLNERTNQRDGQGPCRAYQDWATRGKDVLKRLVLQSARYFHNVNSEEEDADGRYSPVLSDDGETECVMSMGARLWHEYDEADQADKARKAAANAKKQMKKAALGKAEAELSLVSPGQGVEAPSNVPFELKENHVKGLSVLAKNTTSKPSGEIYVSIISYVYCV